MEDKGCMYLIGFAFAMLVAFLIATGFVTWLVLLVIPFVGFDIAYWELYSIIAVLFVLFRFLIPANKN